MNITNCFAELIANAMLFIKRVPTTQPSYEESAAKFKQLILVSRELVGDDPSEFYAWERSLFAVCAWIDEQILLSDWQSKEVWQLDPLQKQYFQTTHAGEKFFEVLDGLQPEIDSQIIEVYLLCIKLGFQGKHFKPANPNQLIGSPSPLDPPIMKNIEGTVEPLFINAYSGSNKLVNTKSKFVVSLEFILFLAGITSFFCLIILRGWYSILLNELIAGYYY